MQSHKHWKRVKKLPIIVQVFQNCKATQVCGIQAERLPTVINSTMENDTKAPESKPSQEDAKPSISQVPKAISPKKEQKKKTFKIIVIGDTGVGKTCLTYRFCSGKFPSTPTDATIGVDFREKLITLDNNEQVNFYTSKWEKIRKN